ncbi:hypothetical protein ES707_13395 [subsurface metagenome]
MGTTQNIITWQGRLDTATPVYRVELGRSKWMVAALIGAAGFTGFIVWWTWGK